MIFNKNGRAYKWWHSWFAWFPVFIWKTDHTEMIWLEWIERIKFPGGYYKYRTKDMSRRCGQ